jgi:predicted aspartyl protease
MQHQIACLTLLMLLLGPSLSHAQPAPPITEDILPIEADNTARMTVAVRVGDSAMRNFIVDTGADRTVISSEAAAALNLAAGKPVKLHSMTGVSTVQTVVIPSLHVARSIITNIRAPILAARHLGADGVLGIDSLKGKRIVIDFRDQQMTLFESAEAEKRDERDLIVIVAKSRFGQLILVDADIAGRKIQVILDTGAQNSVGNTALRTMTARTSSKKTPTVISLVGVTGASTNADYTEIDKIRIGGFTITHAPIAFADVHPFERFGLTRKPALLLGMDILNKFDRVSIDFANRKIKFLLPRDGQGIDRKK